MDTGSLRAFVETAAAGSVSRAARRLGVSQPSLSVQLRNLEEHLAVALFERHARGIVLTDAGRALLPRARRILDDIRTAEESMRREVAAGRGTITVGAIPTIAPYLIPPALERMRVLHPKAQVEIREDYSAALAEALADNLLDCAIVASPYAYDSIETETLGTDALLVAVPAAHPGALRRRVTLDALRVEPAVTLDRAHCLGEQIAGFCTSRQVSPNITCRTAQLSTVFAMVAAGLGVSIVPAMAAHAHADARQVFLPIEDVPLEREIVVAWRRDRAHSPLARAFVGILRDELRALTRRGRPQERAKPSEPRGKSRNNR
jgi:LysR family hydrogen peroxide-inducible transcriptional activator